MTAIHLATEDEKVCTSIDIETDYKVDRWTNDR